MQTLTLDEREDPFWIEREEDDGGSRHDCAEALLTGLQDLFLADTLGDVTGIDDHAVGVGLVESGLPD